MYTTLERKLMGEFSLDVGFFVLVQPVFRASGARQHAFRVQGAHCVFLPQAAHRLGGLLVCGRGTGFRNRLFLLDCIAWVYVDRYLFLNV
jgi:hypothetical protein